MLRIAIDCRMIGSGGIGSYISALIPYLVKGNECLLIGTHEQCQQFLSLESVEFCFCDVKPFALKELLAFPQDVVNKINSYDFYYTPYCNIPSGIEIPIFSTIHDIVFLDVKGLTSPLGRFGRWLFYHRAISYSSALFTVSQFSKERIIKKLGCKKEIAITYNSAQTYLTTPFEGGRPAKEDFILFVGNIKKHKGLSTLLDAYFEAREKGFTSHLVIVGNADNFRTGDEQAVERIQSAPLGTIEFTGKINDEALKNLYAKARFLVQPSLYEGFGMPPLEAMTVGTAALISDIPVFKEIYRNYPVTYFKAGDSKDLCQKLLEFKDTEIDEASLPNQYSYAKSAQTIQSVISCYK